MAQGLDQAVPDPDEEDHPPVHRDHAGEQEDDRSAGAIGLGSPKNHVPAISSLNGEPGREAPMQTDRTAMKPRRAGRRRKVQSSGCAVFRLHALGSGPAAGRDAVAPRRPPCDEPLQPRLDAVHHCGCGWARSVRPLGCQSRFSSCSPARRAGEAGRSTAG